MIFDYGNEEGSCYRFLLGALNARSIKERQGRAPRWPMRAHGKNKYIDV
jgi:hypothetical protein